MLPVRVDSDAARELEEAIAWYERQSPGTGKRLLDAFDTAVRLLEDHSVPFVPVSGAAGRLGAKQLLLHRFPYSVIVVEDDDAFVVLAVAHHARRPGYWMDRLST
ncbi:MAG: hypothetical protein GKR94_22410 [Gammaproteobacteria bacterium]|nr:hypothetical protein [Gammaproteobacteria bacterium]